MPAADDVIVVLTSFPDRAGAESAASMLVADRLAACVQIMAPHQSVYRWNGVVEHAEEVPVSIKTTRAGFAAVERFVRSRHPYDIPEILAVPVVAGSDDYLGWVRSEVTESGT